MVRNPGIDEYFVEIGPGEEPVAVMPHGGHVVLGSTAVEHDWSRTAEGGTTDGILRRCARVDPLLSGAVVLEEKVGLRPGRDAVRVEVERFGGAKIVHNYGHGSCGVALSWGCATAAAELARG